MRCCSNKPKKISPIDPTIMANTRATKSIEPHQHPISSGDTLVDEDIMMNEYHEGAKVANPDMSGNGMGFPLIILI